MPLYEMNLILKPMAKQEIFDTLKRAANLVWQRNGVIKNLEYLGLNKLPYRLKSKVDALRCLEGNYFIYKMSISQSKIPEIIPELRLDSDVIHYKINLVDRYVLPKDYQCTLEEELLQPAYRKSVQPLLKDKNVITNTRL